MRFFPQLGVDPVAALTGPQYFALARRVFAYEGVMTVRAKQWEQEHGSQEQQERPTYRQAANGDREERKVVSFDEFNSKHPGVVQQVKKRR